MARFDYNSSLQKVNLITFRMLSSTLLNLRKASLVGCSKTFMLAHFGFKILPSRGSVCSFGTLKPTERQSSQSILKQYFSSRLTLSTTQLERFLIQLSKNNDVKIRDHRWENLYMTIQKYHKDFSLKSKMEIIHALGRMKQNNSLYLTTYKSIISEFHKLTVEQMSILLWSMVKVKQNDKTTVLAIYKKLYKLLENKEKIKLYKQGEQLPYVYSQDTDINDQLPQVIHHLHESSFIHLIWAIQKMKVIDEKLILGLLKHTLQDKENNNLQKIRIQNLCLLAYCMEEMQFEKYRISQTIINQIMKSWEGLEKLSILSLVLLSESFTNFVFYQQQYLKKYQKNFTLEEILKKQQFLSKQQKFILFIVETILLRQNQSAKSSQILKKKMKNQQIKQEDKDQLVRLEHPLSTKFASQIIFNLGKLSLYNKKIWYQLLTSITHQIDQAQVQDLSMAISGICNLNLKDVPSEDMKTIVYEQKKIMCKRIFQIYTSLSGKSLQKIKELVFQKKIENQFVPSRVRKEVQQEFMALKLKERQREEKNNNNKQQNLDENQQPALHNKSQKIHKKGQIKQRKDNSTKQSKQSKEVESSSIE